MTAFPNLTEEFPRFDKEIIPFDAAIKSAWIDKCEPQLLPLVARDYEAIQTLQFDGKTPETAKKLYIATAGGPCSGKSTELDYELFQSGNDPRYDNLIMVDPDRYTMEYMNYTYRPMMAAWMKASLGVEKSAISAYDRARPGSNIIANLLMNESFNGGYNIAHGITMTGPHIGSLLEKLGQAGYERRLLLCWADDGTRIEAGNNRISKEAHYQVDPSDFVEKGAAFPQRMIEYFRHGDHLKLLWKEEVAAQAYLGAEYRYGQRIIVDAKAFQDFTGTYAAERRELAKKGIEISSFEALEKIYFDRFKDMNAAPKLEF